MSSGVAWIILAIAGLCEIGWAVGLKYTEGFTRLWPSVWTVIAMGQVQPDAMRRLLRKELGVAMINGLLWGSLLGIAAWWLYGSYQLGIVMTGAMTLNLLLAASAGVGIPLMRQKFGADPAIGGSVMITALTDSGGFFIFLGLATLFLM